MAADLRATILAEIDQLLEKLTEYRARYPDPTGWAKTEDIPTQQAMQFNSAVNALVRRVAGDNSSYANDLTAIPTRYPSAYAYSYMPHYAGILGALRDAVASGYLTTVQELVHADLFGDFLDMADYLLSEGYKDPAAVLIGGVLEEHLRKLCIKNSIDPQFTDSNGRVRPKKAEAMNTELAGASVYSKGDQKNVTAWYNLRSDAAHGDYGKYTQQQVELLSQSVRDFITRNPA